MKNIAVYPALALAGGGAAFALRLAQNRTGFESATGLPVPGNLWGRLLVGLLVLVGLVCFLLSRKLPAEKEDAFPAFSDAFTTHSLLLLTVLTAGVFLMAISGLLELAAGLGLMMGTAERLDLVQGVLTLASAGCLFSALPACRRRGDEPQLPEDGPSASHDAHGDLLLVSVAVLVVRLVTAYRQDSVNPALEAYYIGLLALVFLTLALYRLSSFAFRAGQTRRFVLYAVPAVVLCLAALADSRPLYDTLFFAGGGLTVLGFLLLRLDNQPPSRNN